ncbi:hypothetical protein [Brevibacillus sp. SYSU BS000544]|uniref:hypothetical protein n=1 Tax=Brevibacillus sp. SYSU BS000544 TaxID=3416443 RepID=UPI003CE4A2FF
MNSYFSKGCKLLSSAALIATLAIPGLASAAGERQVLEASNNNKILLESEGEFNALQINNRVFVFQNENPLFQTKGEGQLGPLSDLFVLKLHTPDGNEMAIPLIAVKKSKSEYIVFSDLWPKFDDPDNSQADNTIDAYDAGRIYPVAKKKIVSKTKHHYADQIGKEVVVSTANDYDDLSKGYHESIRVEGKLRGLVLYDCCPYVVVEQDGKLNIFHAGANGAEQIGSVDLN